MIVHVHFEPDLVLRPLRERLRLFIGHAILKPLVCLSETSTFAYTKKEDLASGIKPSQKVMQGKRHCSVSFFPHALEVAQPKLTGKDTAADGTLRTLSRIDRAFINVLVAEARYFHCYSDVSDNLREQSIPSDHVAVRLIVQKPTSLCDHVKRIPS